MKKKLITVILSLGISASLLAGCSAPDKLMSSDKAQESASKLDDVKEEGSATDILLENADSVKESESAEELTGHSGESVENDTAEEETAQKVAASQKLPTFRIAEKKYTKMYEGDAVFDKSNEDSIDYSNGMLYEANYQYVLMDEECKDDYPLLYNAINTESKELMSKSDGFSDEAAERAKDDYEDAAKEGYSFFGPYTDHNFVSIKRADSVVMSIYNYNDSFTGGAHGMYGVGTGNYDVQSGEELNLGDVINLSDEELADIIEKKLRESVEDDGQLGDLKSYLKDYKLNPERDEAAEKYEVGYAWYFSNDGVHIYFNPYEIAPYSYGLLDVVIGYDEIDGAIKEEYIPAKNAVYCIKENLYFSSDEYDTDNETLHFRYTPSEYSDGDFLIADSFELIKDGKSAKVDTGFWVRNESSFDIYRIGTEDGKEYIYIIVPEDNDYASLYAFDISNGDVKLLGEQFYHYFEESLDNYYSGDPILTDPHNMKLGQVGDAFGTYTYYGIYDVGEDGLPVPPYAIYNIGGGQPENLFDYISTLQEELVRAGVLPADYDFEGHRELVGMQAGDVPITYADSSALERDYGFTPKTGIREGLRKFAEWYKEYYG